jgi:hypothetical protein
VDIQSHDDAGLVAASLLAACAGDRDRHARPDAADTQTRRHVGGYGTGAGQRLASVPAARCVTITCGRSAVTLWLAAAWRSNVDEEASRVT